MLTLGIFVDKNMLTTKIDMKGQNEQATIQKPLMCFLETI